MSTYTTTTNKLKITELDFDQIKTALKTYLSGQSEFQDYDFTGSAMNILLDVLAYNTHYNGFYANMLASEMFLDSATLRSSIVSLAKHLGYVPSSKKGSTVNIDVTFTGSGSSITVPKNTKFTTKINNDTYTFLTTETKVAQKSATDGTYSISGLKIVEGVYLTSSQTVIGRNNEVFSIPNDDIDLDTLVVALAGEVYAKADDITEIKSTDKVYFIQEGTSGLYEVYFGDGVIGKKAETGDTVQMQYNISMLGADGNGAKTFTLADNISGATGQPTITLSSGHTRTSGGTEREATSTVRINAPRQYTLQKRVVTADDYRARLINDYTAVDSVRVWGGEENKIPDYGSVYISIKPKTGYVLSYAERQKIAQDVLKKRNMVNITPKFVDPHFVWIVPDVSVAYDPRKTTRDEDAIKTLVKNTVLAYSSASLGKFGEYFRHSLLTRAIDDSEVSIANSTVGIKLKARIKPVLRIKGTYTVRFWNQLHHPHKGHASNIRSTSFRFKGLDGCYLEDHNNEVYVVRSQTPDVQTNDYLTNKIQKVGVVDYASGELLLEDFMVQAIGDGSDYVYITADPEVDDIIPQQNTILTIESGDITVNCVDDTRRIPEKKVQGY